MSEDESLFSSMSTPLPLSEPPPSDHDEHFDRHVLRAVAECAPPKHVSCFSGAVPFFVYDNGKDDVFMRSAEAHAAQEKLAPEKSNAGWHMSMILPLDF